MPLIRIPIVPAKETDGVGEPTVALPLNPMDEAEEALDRQRECKLREIAWLHLEAAHERFCDDTEAGHSMAAYSESHCVMEWINKVQELEGGGGGTEVVVIGGED